MPFIIEKLKWQGVFYVTGGFGICWFIFWCLFAADTPQSMKIFSKI